MYNLGMIRLYRSPDGGEGGGGLPEGGNVDPGAGGEPQRSEYVSKADFDAAIQRFERTLSGFNRQEPKRDEPKNDGEKTRERPKPSDYDFQKDPGALQRYEDDLDEWRYQERRKREKAETEENERKAAGERNERGHRQRVADYAKQNPDYAEDAKRAGNIQVFDEVKRTIFASKNSAAVLHYLFKNPGEADELNTLAETDGLEAVREKIGEYAAEMRRQKKDLDTNASAAGVRPPRQSMRGGGSGSKRELSQEERYRRYHE